MASVALAAESPAQTSVTAKPASTNPRPPGVIGIIPSTLAATYARSNGTDSTRAPVAATAATSAK